MISIHNIAVGSGLNHVAFQVSRQVAAAELRMTGGLIAVLVLAIGVCGSVLPPRSGWLPPAPAADTAVPRLSVEDGLRGDVRPAWARGEG